MLARAISGLFRNMGERELALGDPDAWDELFGGTMTSSSGMKVGHKQSMSLAPVWQSLSTISGDVAIARPNLYRRDSDDERSIVHDNPIQVLVSSAANEETSAFELWRRAVVHLLLWGNAYIYIDRLGGPYGPPAGLYTLLPDRTKPVREGGKRYFETIVDGKKEVLFSSEVLHIKGLSVDIGMGADMVKMARDSWGLALAAEGFSAKFFANGAQSGGVLEIPPQFTVKAAKNLEEGWAKKYTGKENWFKTVILRDGAKFHGVTIDAEKSQLHEMREDQVRDVARFFNLPPSKLGLSDSVSYKSFEQSQIAYVTGCLQHLFATITGECSLKFLTAKERLAMFFEHNYSKLIESDSKTMNEVLEIQRRNEVINANEWRRKINLPKRKDGGGDAYINPNTKSKETGDPAKVDQGGQPKNQQAKAIAASLDVLRDVLDRMCRRVAGEANARARDSADFLGWVDCRCASEHAVFGSAILPPVTAVCACLGGRDVDRVERITEAFFTDVATRLAKYVAPPYAAADLGKYVAAEGKTWPRDIPARLVGQFFGDQKP